MVNTTAYRRHHIDQPLIIDWALVSEVQIDGIAGIGGQHLMIRGSVALPHQLAFFFNFSLYADFCKRSTVNQVEFTHFFKQSMLHAQSNANVTYAISRVDVLIGVNKQTVHSGLSGHRFYWVNGSTKKVDCF